MAIAADILLATSASPSSTTHFTISISNIEQKYQSALFAFPLNRSIEFDSKVHDWTNYFKGGLCGALELLRKQQDCKASHMAVVAMWSKYRHRLLVI
jgi:galactokinase